MTSDPRTRHHRRTIYTNKNNEEKKNKDDGAGGASTSIRKRLRFWQRNKQAATVEAATVDTLQLMAQSLQQETSNVGERVGMPVMVLEGVEEKKSLARCVVSNLLLPKSLISYASREGGIL
mmetsp:Transcript_24025/g.41167  ORF Transcript_24025/g.41167 Transcript_24025/m.41167 type:complete len:121 (+) Transcript_24025:802-1164(+)